MQTDGSDDPDAPDDTRPRERKSALDAWLEKWYAQYTCDYHTACRLWIAVAIGAVGLVALAVALMWV